jgi:hypothetical protein
MKNVYAVIETCNLDFDYVERVRYLSLRLAAAKEVFYMLESERRKEWENLFLVSYPLGEVKPEYTVIKARWCDPSLR